MDGDASERAVDIYADGVCAGAGGPGGWGAVLRYGTYVRDLNGGEPGPTTNGRMELMAAVRGLERLTRPSWVRVHTRSAYVRDGITTRPNGDVDLWQRLADALRRHRVEWIRAEVSTGDLARADALARSGIAVVDPLARCVHDLVRNECVDCRPARAGLPARVAITPGGAVFHVDARCEALHEGWRRLSRSGGTPGELVWAPMADALAKGRGGCERCCAHLDLT